MKYPPILMIFSLLMIVLLNGCNRKPEQGNSLLKPSSQEVESTISKANNRRLDYNSEHWKEVGKEDGIHLEIRYATKNNFTKEQIYPCGRCFLRPEMADKIIQLQKDIFKRYGMSLKLFDCYRPRPAQQKLWDIVPDARYVTPPDKGSMHNRGLAVDITLVDKSGNELDMGTAYDYFGIEAHTTYTDLPEGVLKNRRILEKMMDVHGLKGIETEWWHYSLKTVQFPFDDWQWPCEE